jgi:glycosyltransferase involved in cell wall biosynthesis
MTRILHILSQRPGRSGSGVFLGAMVREAARRGYAQHVAVAGPPGTTAAELPPLGDGDVTPIVFPCDDAPFPLPGNSDVMPYPTTVFSRMTPAQIEQYLAVTRRVLERVKRAFRPDLVHAHHLWLMTALAREVFAETPMVVSSHNAELRQLVKAPHLGRHLAPLRDVDRVCVLTPQSVDDTVAAFGIERERIALTGAGYDGALFRVASDAPRENTVTFVGRLSTAKGIPFLIEAMRGVDARLLLVGATGTGEDGRRNGELVAAATGVEHLGARAPEDVAAILQRTSVFVLPSLFEGLPLTMLEALGCGTPVVVSALPTIASWIAQRDFGDAVCLVPLLETTNADEPVAADVPRFVGDLAAAIRAALASPLPRERVAVLVSDDTWRNVFARYELAYAEAMQRRAAVQA